MFPSSSKCFNEKYFIFLSEFRNQPWKEQTWWPQGLRVTETATTNTIMQHAADLYVLLQETTVFFRQHSSDIYVHVRGIPKNSSDNEWDFYKETEFLCLLCYSNDYKVQSSTYMCNSIWHCYRTPWIWFWFYLRFLNLITLFQLS